MGEDGNDIRVVIRQVAEETDVDVGPGSPSAKLAS